ALLEHRMDGGPTKTIVDYTPSLAPHFVGSSEDGSESFFESRVKLTSTAIEGKSNLYVWDRDDKELSLAGVENDEKPPAPEQGVFAGPYDWVRGTNETTLKEGGAARLYYTQDDHAVSADGSVYFTAPGSGQLYLRRNPTETQS